MLHKDVDAENNLSEEMNPWSRRKKKNGEKKKLKQFYMNVVLV